MIEQLGRAMQRGLSSALALLTCRDYSERSPLHSNSGKHSEGEMKKISTGNKEGWKESVAVGEEERMERAVTCPITSGMCF